MSDLCLSYPDLKGGTTPVLNRLSLGVAEGEVLAVVGPNGCGKTTLLYAIAGVIKADCGEVSIAGKPQGEARVGLVFQNYREALMPWLSARENVLFPLALGGVSEQEAQVRLDRLLEEVQTKLELPWERYSYQLSGGQQQMISILRALLSDPDVLLLDEPFASLDYRARLAMHHQMQEILLRRRKTTIIISHEIDEAILLSDRILVLTPRPARISGAVEVDLARPRSRDVVVTDAFLQIKRQVFDLFQA